MNKRRWLAGLAGAMAGGVAVATSRGAGQALDRRLFAAVNRGRGPMADRFFEGITELGSIWASVGATAAISLMGRRREAVDALGAATATWALGQILKRVVLRPRPYDVLDGVRLLIDEPRGTSWPSSHPAVLLAFVTVAARNLEAPSAIRVGLAGLAGAIGFSRIYLGVHYPADGAGGLLMGRAMADLWSSALSPMMLAPPPFEALPGTVSG